MGVALKDLKGRVKRPVRAVTICLDGDLWAQHDEATARMESLRQGGTGAKMGDSSALAEAAEQVRAIEAQMRESEVTIEFRGVSTYQLKTIQARFPSKDPRMDWDATDGAHALIAACAVEPTTEDEAKGFLEDAHQAVARKLVSAAWEATTGSDDVPFSARASALIAASASN